MAAEFTSQTQGEINMKDLVKCIICKSSEISSTLKMLPCFYSACTNCLRKGLEISWTTTYTYVYRCPGCQHNHSMRYDGIQGLNDNFFYTKMKFLSEVMSNNPPPCKACEAVAEEKPSSVYCLPCRTHFCQSDGKKHTATTGHVVVSQDDMSAESIIPKIISSDMDKCTESEIHDDPKLYEHYCIRCKTLCCGNCLIYKHKDHEIMPLKKASHNFEEKLKIMVSEMKASRLDMEENLTVLNDNMFEMKKNKDATVQKIKSFGETVKNLVDKFVAEKLTNLEIEGNEEEENIDLAIADTKRELDLVNMAEQHMTMFLENSSPNNIILYYGVLHEKLEKCQEYVDMLDTQKVQAKAFNFHHETTFQINRRLAKMFDGKYLQGGNNFIYRSMTEGFKGIVVDPGNNDIIGAGGKDVIVVGMDGNAKGHIQCQGLKNACAVVAHDEVIYILDKYNMEIVGFDRKGNRKKVIKCPEEIGTNDDSLGFALNPLNGNFYISSSHAGSIFEFITARMEVLPFITTGLCSPSQLCVIPNKGLVVSVSHSHEIHMYSFDGTWLWKYGSEGKGDRQFRYPAGVCTDHLDNIFVADELNRRVHYISSKGSLILHIELDITPWCLSYFNGRLIVKTNHHKLEIIKCNYD